MKPKYKLLSIDLDGTLLTKFKRITRKDLISLYRYSSAGGNIFINTGKSLQSTYKYLNKIQTVTNNMKYCSCLNGNLIYDINKKKVIHYNSIMANDCQKIYDIIQKHNKHFMSYDVEDYSQPIELKESSNFKILSQRYKQIMHYNRTSDPKIKESHKINIVSVMKPIDHVIAEEIEQLGDVDVIQTNNRLFEIVKKGSNKGTSLNKVMDLYGFKKEEVAAIGDSNNDLEMFKAAGTSFLVNKKAPTKLKKEANAVISTKKNKVTQVIEHYILTKVN